MNRLSREKASYLKHAAHQNIEWYPWSEEAFERARKEDRPVFLSSGAIWCHWCHVMAKECFYNEEIIALLNENFVNVKLDRDERPDIDRRYQRAVSAMGAGSGWPLSVFLTPDKKPFFGGTYFPPEDGFGRPGFKKVLKAVVELYRNNRADVERYTERIMEALKPVHADRGEITEALVDETVKRIAGEVDLQNGGFGTAPKFPVPGALSLMINRYFLGRSELIGHAVRRTLYAMAAGGFHDQLKGGFHRYSVDESWIVPHFEKMADDNAWLLKNYADAYQVFGDGYFSEVAHGIIAFARDVLSDAEGGFYASQDADVTPDDEGGYFTWTEDDFRKALDDEEYAVLSRYFLHERGAMHHEPSKKVLFVALDKEKIAAETGIDPDKVAEVIVRGKKRLLHERDKRESPFIDTALYTSLNGLFISAYLKAFRAFGESGLKEFALMSLDKIMRLHYTGDELFHSEGVKALLDDYVYLIEALIGAYEVAGNRAYLDKADALMGLCIERFWDTSGGGFFDADTEVVGVRLKGIEDLPHPSANATAVMLLLQLHHATGKDIYRRYAETALSAFSSGAANLGVHAGYFFCALDAYFNMMKLTLETAPGSALADAALSSFYPYKTLVYGEDKHRVIPCTGAVCREPIENPDHLREYIESAVRT